MSGARTAAGILGVAALALAGALAFVPACSTSSGDPLCVCEDTEKFNGDACVDAAEFVEPECDDDDVQVCGCDDANYTSTCAAYKAGVEVKYGGACRAGGGGGGGGFDFGW